MSDSYPLGNTSDTVTVDQDEVRVSFGCDGSEIHCWTCGTDDMEGGAWLIRKPLARFAEHARYWADRYPGLKDERKHTVVCFACVRRIDPNDRYSAHIATDRQNEVDRQWAAAGIGAN